MTKRWGSSSQKSQSLRPDSLLLFWTFLPWFYNLGINVNRNAYRIVYMLLVIMFAMPKDGCA